MDFQQRGQTYRAQIARSCNARSYTCLPFSAALYNMCLPLSAARHYRCLPFSAARRQQRCCAATNQLSRPDHHHFATSPDVRHHHAVLAGSHVMAASRDSKVRPFTQSSYLSPFTATQLHLFLARLSLASSRKVLQPHIIYKRQYRGGSTTSALDDNIINVSREKLTSSQSVSESCNRRDIRNPRQ